MGEKQLYLGNRNKIDNEIGISEQFMDMAIADEKTAELLSKNQYYNQAIYFYIQDIP